MINIKHPTPAAAAEQLPGIDWRDDGDTVLKRRRGIEAQVLG
jgi:hypothetical protein